MQAFFSFFFVLFAEVRKNLFPCREAEIARERNAGNAVPTMLHLFTFNLYDALDAVIRAVKVQVAFFDFLFHVTESKGDFSSVDVFLNFIEDNFRAKRFSLCSWHKTFFWFCC